MTTLGSIIAAIAAIAVATVAFFDAMTATLPAAIPPAAGIEAEFTPRSEGSLALRSILLLDHTSRIVTLTVTVLGAASGFVGTFLVLRRRALLGDTMAHAMLPGVVLAFMVMVLLGADGRHLGVLLAGGLLSGLIGVFGVLAIDRTTRLGSDAAMAIILGGLFGVGVALLGIAQRNPGASAAGLATLIYGKAASMLRQDAVSIVTIATVVSSITILAFKELRLLCFDERYAESQGWPVTRLDVLLVLLIALIVVAGLQAVGLILVVALLVIPPATARLWTNRLTTMAIASAVIGAVSGGLGTQVSALLPRAPTGPVIVLVAASMLAVSVLFGARGGLLPRWWRRHRERTRSPAETTVSHA